MTEGKAIRDQRRRGKYRDCQGDRPGQEDKASQLIAKKCFFASAAGYEIKQYFNGEEKASWRVSRESYEEFCSLLGQAPKMEE